MLDMLGLDMLGLDIIGCHPQSNHRASRTISRFMSKRCYAVLIRDSDVKSCDVHVMAGASRTLSTLLSTYFYQQI